MTEAEAVRGVRKAAKARERALDARRKATDDLRERSPRRKQPAFLSVRSLARRV